jgi:hypothetical protein
MVYNYRRMSETINSRITEENRLAYIKELHERASAGNTDADEELSLIALGGYVPAQQLIIDSEKSLLPQDEQDSLIESQ